MKKYNNPSVLQNLADDDVYTQYDWEIREDCGERPLSGHYRGHGDHVLEGVTSSTAEAPVSLIRSGFQIQHR